MIKKKYIIPLKNLLHFVKKKFHNCQYRNDIKHDITISPTILCIFNGFFNKIKAGLVEKKPFEKH